MRIERYNFLQPGILCLSLIILGCRFEEDKNNCEGITHKIFGLKRIDHISIPVPDSLNYELTHTQVLCESGNHCYYFGFDPINNSIDAYDLNDKKLINSLRFASDGRPGSFVITAYYVYNADSIFLFSEESYTLLLVNIRNEVEKIWDLKNAMTWLEKSHPGIYLDLSDNDMLYSGSEKMIFFKISNERYPIGSNRFFNSPLVAGFDLRKQEFTQVFGNYPAEVKTNPNPLSVAFRLEAIEPDGGLLLNFYGLHSLIEIYQGGLTRGICRKSSFLAWNYAEYEDDFSNFSSFQKYIIQNGYYVKCLTHENLRIIIVKHDVSQAVETRPLTAYDAPFSILILTNDKISGEVLFSPKRYNYFNTHLVNGKYMIIDSNNIYSPEAKEGFLEFDVFELN